MKDKDKKKKRKQRTETAIIRKLYILRMIPRAKKRIGHKEIEEKLKNYEITADKRTIQRDLEDLSGWFAISCDHKKPYGWSWMKEADSFDIPRMDPVSALSFKMAQQYLSVLMPPSTFKALTPYFSHASQVLNDENQVKIKSWFDKISMISRNQPLIHPCINPDIMETVYECLLEGKRFSVVYKRRGMTDTDDYIVNPLGIVLLDSVVYLVCTLRDYDQLKDVRHLSLHRMASAEKIIDDGFVPEGFNLQAYIDSGAFGYLQSEQKISLKAAFDQEVAQHLFETPISENQVSEIIDSDRILIKASVSDTAQLRWWLLGFGNKVEVLEPLSLREEFSEISKKLNDRYSK